MAATILLMDNTPEILDKWGKLLERAGYHVLRAATLEDAEDMLRRRRIHLAILDIRMQSEDDENDISGLLLAQKHEFRFIPKIILTAYPSFEYVRTVLAPAMEGSPFAVNFIAKTEGPQALRQAITKSFDDQVRINTNLHIRWQDPASLPFLHLLTLVESDPDESLLTDRSGELEDLLRKLFYASEQITIGQTLAQRKGYVALEVTAYPPEGRPESLVVTCGAKPQVEKETESYKKFASLSARGGGVIWAGPVETVRFAAVAYSIPGVEVADAKTFSEYYCHSSARSVQLALDNLFKKALAPCYDRDRAMEEMRTLNELWLEDLGLTEEKLPWAALAHQVKSLCREAMVAGFMDVEHTRDTLTFRFGDGTDVAYPNPVSYLHDRLSVVDPPVLCGPTHGNLDGHTFLVDRQGRSWLIDFGQVDILRPLLYDFVTLEAVIRFDLMDLPDPIVWHALETCLSGTAQLEESETEFHKAVNTIQQIRTLALTKTGDDLRSYLVGLLCSTVGKLAAYDPKVRYTRQEIAPYAHALLLAATLCGTLAEFAERPTQATKGLWIDIPSREVWVEGRQIQVTKLEFELAAFLFDHCGEACSRDSILSQLYPREIRDPEADVPDNRVDVVIGRLRKKIEPDPTNPRYVLTVRDVGYKLVAD